MILEDLDDKQLMARTARGDEEAFKGLVLRHQNEVFRLAYRYLSNPMEAEDIAQETFIRLFDAASRYRPDAAFRTYLLKIATNLCLNRRARLYRRLEEGRDPADRHLSDFRTAEPNPEQAVLQFEQIQAVRRAILALPYDQRMALILFRFEELSYDSIAEVMGKSTSAVTSLIWRASEQLRQGLQEWAGGQGVAQERVESSVRECRRLK